MTTEREILTAFAASLDDRTLLPWLLFALVAGGAIAGLWWCMTRPRRALRMLMRRVQASRG